MKITEEYLAFARRQLHGHPDLAKAYNQNHGIIKMRDDFLASKGLKGSDIIRQEQDQGEVSNDEVTGDVILVPAATIGCGKTTVALALCKLFDWGHVQNDNITVKRGKPQAFANQCCKALEEYPAMVADRNNHQRRERQQLIDDASRVVPNARFVSLHFVHDRDNFDNIRAALRDRVLSRGDNHQTIHTSKGSDEIIGIMEGFMQRFEPVNPQAPPDDGFDLVIDLDPVSSSRQNLETVVSRLYIEYPKLFGDQEMPTAGDMDAAIEAAMNDYQVDLKHEIKSRDDRPKGNKQQNGNNAYQNGTAKPKQRGVEFFAVQIPATRVSAVLEAIFNGVAPDVAKMYNTLKAQRRVQAEFHVTLIHRAMAGQYPEQWSRLTDLHTQASQPNSERAYAIPDPKLGACKVRLERVVWDSRIMALVVRLSPMDGSNEQFSSVNQTAHITIGTASPDVKPKESNDLLARWLREGSGANGIQELAVKGNVELEGTVKATLSR